MVSTRRSHCKETNNSQRAPSLQAMEKVNGELSDPLEHTKDSCSQDSVRSRLGSGKGGAIDAPSCVSEDQFSAPSSGSTSVVSLQQDRAISDENLTNNASCSKEIHPQSHMQALQNEKMDLHQLSLLKGIASEDDKNNNSLINAEHNSDNSAARTEATLTKLKPNKEMGVAPNNSNQGIPCVSNGTGTREQPRDNFGWLVQTGIVITIDPLDTIPLACIRDVCDSGVAKLEFAFLRSEDGPGMSMGVSSAAPQPIVVRIPENQLHVVIDYFVASKGLSIENAHAISNSKVWYGIVEGAHRRKALINLGEKVPSRFKGYPWVVLCIDWQPLDVLRAFARERNEFQRGEHLVDFTMFDVFKNLKQAADQVALREGLTNGRTTNRGYLKRVADQYCGGTDTANNLTRQLAGIAVVLSWTVIEEMGKLLNKEDPTRAREIAKASTKANANYVDSRLCKDLFTRSTFRGATTFKSVGSEEDQINTLKRLSFLAPQRDYKTVSKSELESQTKKAIAARREVEKMQDKLGGHNWPADMVSVKEALLRTTTLDADVEENKGSSELTRQPQKVTEGQDSESSSGVNSGSGRAGNVDENSEIGQDAVIEERANPNEVTVQENEVVENTIFEENGIDTFEGISIACDIPRDDEDSRDVEPCGEVQKVRDGEDTTQLCPLNQFSVRAENKGWRQFQMTLLTEDLFDFIFADPVQSLSALELKQNQWTEFKDDKNIRAFANFCRLSLRPGCYVFIIVLAEEVKAFSTAFQAEGMKVMKAPFLIIPKAESVRVTRLKDVPQDCGELAVVAKSPGTCASFKPDFSRPCSLFECSFKRKIGIMDNAPRCQNPLRVAKSRAEVRPRERHPDFVSEVIETFCAPTGTVLDIFGGGLTTAISCVSSRRPCVVLEQDKYCFDLAVRRLEKLCRDLLLNPDEVPTTEAEEPFEEDDK